jgi:Zn-dependent alcohol dehydrogenase
LRPPLDRIVLNADSKWALPPAASVKVALTATRCTATKHLSETFPVNDLTQVRGIIEGESIPKLFIPKLLDFYSQGRFPFDRLVKFYDFNLFNEAIADSESGRVIKAIIRMSQV